jgi:hypothetical protein
MDLRHRQLAIAAALRGAALPTPSTRPAVVQARLTDVEAAPLAAATAATPVAQDPQVAETALAEAVARAVREAIEPITLKVDARFDDVERTLSVIEARIDADDAQRTAVQRRIDAIETALAAIRDQAGDALIRLDELSERLERTELALPEDETTDGAADADSLPADRVEVPPHAPLGRMSSRASRALFGD